MPVTTNEFIAAVAREGGVVSALNSGLKAVDLDDQNSELAKAWGIAEHQWEAFKVEPLGDVWDLMPDEAANPRCLVVSHVGLCRKPSFFCTPIRTRRRSLSSGKVRLRGLGSSRSTK